MLNKSAVLYTEENGIARITLNRPESLNALNRDVLEQLSSALDRLKLIQV
ncbi:enoyl-CoA hydratase/isomerase family protein [Bacillus thuringiensis]|nr:hypothetical protein [Bacillus thuringiensis]MDC7735264.1 hypothetical protein [Bacillus thuringiensis]